MTQAADGERPVRRAAWATRLHSEESVAVQVRLATAAHAMWHAHGMPRDSPPRPRHVPEGLPPSTSRESSTRGPLAHQCCLGRGFMGLSPTTSSSRKSTFKPRDGHHQARALLTGHRDHQARALLTGHHQARALLTAESAGHESCPYTMRYPCLT
jgi:hypothetical protein